MSCLLSIQLASQKISRLEQSMANHLYNAQDKTFDGTVEMDGSQLQKRYYYERSNNLAYVVTYDATDLLL